MKKVTALTVAAFAAAWVASPASAGDGKGWNPFRWVEDLGVEVLHCYPDMGKSWTATQVMNAVRICRVEAEEAKAAAEQKDHTPALAQEPATAQR